MDNKVKKYPTYEASIILFSYNQAFGIEGAVRSVLEQQCEPLEIILSDDCSSDDTFRLMQKVADNYDGPHKLIVRQNSRNLGLIGHITHLVDIASSDFLILAAGDDISKPHRARVLIEAFHKTNARLLFSDAETFAHDGGDGGDGYRNALFYQSDFSLKQAALNFSLYLGATAALHRDLYRDYGSTIEPDAYEDLILGFRAAMENSYHHIPENLVRYREGVGLSYGSGSTNWVQQRKKLLRMQVAVLRQRLKDAVTFGLAENDPVRQALRKKLRWKEMQSMYWEMPSAPVGRFFRNPPLMIAYLEEWYRHKRKG